MTQPSDEQPSALRLTHEPEGFARYLSIGCVVLAGMLTLFFFQWASEGRWMLKAHSRVVELSAQFLPVPFAFLAWVYVMERMEKFKLSFSPVFCILSMECFFAVQMARPWYDLSQWLLGAAIIAGFFVLVPFMEAMRRIWQQPRPAFVALFAATAAFNYYALLRSVWEIMCTGTANVVYGVMKLFGYNVGMRVEFLRSEGVGRSVIRISSPDFGVLVFPDCSGLEGIFLFGFLLSVMLLLDWELFKRKSILLLYAFGAVYMFFMNALRIFVFFSIGYWAYRPGAWEWMQSLRGAPIMLFHSYIGWVFYLIAFGVFAWWMYRSAGRKQLTGGGQ